MILDLALVGFGNVGRRFVRLLQERRSELLRTFDLDFRIVGITTARHGFARVVAGIDPSAALAVVEQGGLLDTLDAPAGMPGVLAPPAGGVEFIEQLAAAVAATGEPRHLVVVETTVLDILAGQPAVDHVRAALRAGAHVITANKGPVAFAAGELRALARRAERAFLFEGAVMDGIPVFNLAERTLPAVRVEGFRGVVNSTTNYILTAMENGREFGEALAEMQSSGIAEANASLDVDGWDAAAKGAALANVLLEACITPQQVLRTGIGSLTGEQVREAVTRGRHVKLVVRGRRENGGCVVSVGPEELPAGDLLAGLRDQQNAVILETDLLGDLAIVQLGGGLLQTAYALVSDLVAVRAGLPAPPAASSRRSR